MWEEEEKVKHSRESRRSARAAALTSGSLGPSGAHENCASRPGRAACRQRGGRWAHTPTTANVLKAQEEDREDLEVI